ncbi:MAG: hypothetical protein HY369_02720 [Candidatus Aenigmarchaeota archaeon]|nr:hypothetical protein [Candidatus Aenigmarchaeota archaeon]
MRTGQVEIIVVLAIVIVAIIAILLATVRPPASPPLSQEGQAARASLSHLITTGADEALRTLSLYGGYASPTGTVVFLGDLVPYWQKEGDVVIPPVEQQFISFTETFINENKEAFIADASGLEVGEANVVATILPSKIDLTVSLPATLNGDPLPATYEVSIPTKFGNIVEFAEAFSYDEIDHRYLEMNTVATLFTSPIESGEHVTPFFVALTDCGAFYFKTWSDLKPAVEERVQVALAHTYMPGKVPLNVGAVTSYPKYSLPKLNGKDYADVEVSFHLPDDFVLTPNSLRIEPNPIVATAKPVPLTAICVSDPIYVTYSLRFPVIVRAEDTLTGNIFQFVHQVSIEDNQPAPWSTVEQGIQEQVCTNQLCQADIQATSASGQAVTGADVFFMGCSIGQTGATGQLAGPIPCGIGNLEVYKTGYAVTSTGTTSDELAAAVQVTVPKMLAATVYVYQVNVQEFGGKYTIDAITPLPAGRKLMLTMDTLSGDSYTMVFGPVGTLNSVPAGDFGIIGNLVDDTLQQAFGQIDLVHLFPEDTPELHIYVPNNYQFSQLNQVTDGSAIAAKGLELTNLLQQCGLPPISAAPADPATILGCSKGVNDV